MGVVAPVRRRWLTVSPVSSARLPAFKEAGGYTWLAEAFVGKVSGV